MMMKLMTSESYIHICVCTYMLYNMWIFKYIYIERDGERDLDFDDEAYHFRVVYVCVYNMYIHTFIY